jgi:ATP-dependent DNA helicase RecQ
MVELLESQGGNPNLLDFYHAHVDKANEVAIPKRFASIKSNVRCLLSTVAFGLGMQVPNVSFVIHWGPPPTVLDYLQEIGRCGRDGRNAKAILYKPPNTVRRDRVDVDMMSILSRAESQCIRFSMLKALKLKQFSDAEIEKHCYGTYCCSFCDVKSSLLANKLVS